MIPPLRHEPCFRGVAYDERSYKSKLLELLTGAVQAEVRWHIAVMVPRLPLTNVESRKVFLRILDYTHDCSSIVRTSAMQALHDLALRDGSLRQEALLHIKDLMAVGSAAMRARGKKLIGSIEHAVP